MHQCKLKTLCEKIENCTLCRLSLTRNKSVCGEGKSDAKIFFVAQAPGQEENNSGKILIGPAGKIFNNLLLISELKREEIYITNLLKCFLPKYRRPKWDEIFKCREYLFEEIKIVKPKIIVPLGYYSTRTILEYFHFPVPERRNQYNTIFGKVFRRDIIVYPLPHPALIFHDFSRKKGIEKGFLKLKEIYRELT